MSLTLLNPHHSQESTGVILILLSNLLWGLHPVLAHLGAKQIAPLLYAASTILLAGLFSFLYLLLRKRGKELFNRQLYFNVLMISLLIIVIPYSLFFTGAKYTSGLNASFLLLSELVFVMIFTHFIGEKTTGTKVLGAGGILVGAGLMTYQSGSSLNWGDALVIISTITYPIGTFYSKRALQQASPETILFFRSLLGGLILLGLAFAFGLPENWENLMIQNWKLILLGGFGVAFVNKVMWYEGLKRLDISKATSLSMTFPLFSLFFLIVFFNEPITVAQGFGMLMMMIGVYFAIKRPSVQAKDTKYAVETLNLNE